MKIKMPKADLQAVYERVSKRGSTFSSGLGDWSFVRETVDKSGELYHMMFISKDQRIEINVYREDGA